LGLKPFKDVGKAGFIAGWQDEHRDLLLTFKPNEVKAVRFFPAWLPIMNHWVPFMSKKQGRATFFPMMCLKWNRLCGYAIESGEKLIGISMPKYIITKAPAPLDWARVSQPMLGTPRAIAVASKAPHPNAARLFVDYWLSEKAMGMLAKDVGEYVLAPGVFPPIDGIDKAKVIAIRELSDEETNKWGSEFKKIFDVR